MNRKEYNDIIKWTLKHDETANIGNSLDATRSILRNMGLALPQGDLKRVSEVLKTNDYMGWKECTFTEALEATLQGTAAISVSEDRIEVMTNDENEKNILTNDLNHDTLVKSNVMNSDLDENSV